MFGKNKITKTIKIEGMSCEHCSKKVEKALKEIKQVKAVKAFLNEKKAEIILKEDIDNNIFKNIIEELGFEIIEVN